MTLTCIFKGLDGVECAQTPDTLVQYYDRSRGDLVALQEHLRDEHLHCTTTQLQVALRHTFRMVWQPHTAAITFVRHDEAWDPQKHEPYTKVEYCLADGRPWLRGEP